MKGKGRSKRKERGKEDEEERKELEKQFLKFPELEEDEKLRINLKKMILLIQLMFMLLQNIQANY